MSAHTLLRIRCANYQVVVTRSTDRLTRSVEIGMQLHLKNGLQESYQLNCLSHLSRSRCTHWVLIGREVWHPLLILLRQDRVLRWNDGTGLREIDGDDDDGAVDGASSLLQILAGDWVLLGDERLADTTDLRSGEGGDERESRKD